MKYVRWSAFLVSSTLLLAAACSFDEGGLGDTDAPTGTPDASVIDADVTVLDATAADAVVIDAGLPGPDAAPPDAAVPDATPPTDTPPPDADPCAACDDLVGCTDNVCDPMTGCMFVDNCATGMTCDTVQDRCEGTIVFVDGASYTDTRDTFLREGAPDANAGLANRFEWDADDSFGAGGENVGLLWFANIVANAPGRIPPGATILSATLRLTVLDPSNGPESAELHDSLVAWNETMVRWNSFGGDPGVQTNEIDALVASVPPIQCPCPASLSIDVTSSVQKWSDGTIVNQGWVMVPQADDATEVASSDNPAADARPSLTVDFTVP